MLTLAVPHWQLSCLVPGAGAGGSDMIFPLRAADALALATPQHGSSASGYRIVKARCLSPRCSTLLAEDYASTLPWSARICLPQLARAVLVCCVTTLRL